jgi:hypothetical protein
MSVKCAALSSSIIQVLCFWDMNARLISEQSYAIYDYLFKFLGAFAKFRKATISFVLSVRPSTWKNSAPTGRIFMKFDIWVFFENLSRKFKFH